MKKIQYILGCFSLLLISCSSITNPRIVADSEAKEAIARSLNISNNDTLYSDSLRCFGRQINHFLKEGEYQRLKVALFSIDDIYDKTEKLYPKNSTAMSDLVLSALNKMSVFLVYDYETGSYERSKINYISSSYPRTPGQTTQDVIQALVLGGLVPNQPIGVLKPADFIINGALTQYDMIESNSLDLDLDVVGYSQKLNIIDVGIDLRLVDANTGIIVVDIDSGENTSSIYLKNRLITSKNNDAGFFKVINSKKFGVNLDYSVSDPQYYAVRELVELGVLELISKLISIPWKEYCSLEKIHS